MRTVAEEKREKFHPVHSVYTFLLRYYYYYYSTPLYGFKKQNKEKKKDNKINNARICYNARCVVVLRRGAHKERADPVFRILHKTRVTLHGSRFGGRRRNSDDDEILSCPITSARARVKNG